MVDLGCTGRKDGQTDSTRTREKRERKKDKQSPAVENYWQKVGRHSEGTQMAAKGVSRETGYSTRGYGESKEQ